MAAPRRWSTTQDTELRALHATGKSLHEIAKAMGWAKDTVSRHAARLELSWDRSRTAKATEAKTLDAQARRANAVLAELEILELNQAAVLATMRGNNSWPTLVRSEGGAEEVRLLDFLPSRDAREATNARSGSAAIIDRLTDHDTGATAVRSLLTGLADALGLPDETAPTT